MTVYLKNVETGHIFEFDGEKEAQSVNKKLLQGKYELLNKEKIDKTELEKLEIPEVSTVLPMKKRLLTRKKV